MDRGQIFENNFDCYADTWKDNNDTIPPTMIEGDVVMAMTKDNFVKVVKELLVKRDSQCGKLQKEVESRRKQITDINQWTEILLHYRSKIRERPLWSIIADINNRTTD
jgi:hypothetical protein